MDLTRDALVMQAKKMPSAPGVYIFKTADGEVVYVGKAKNLKNRLRSYIQRLGIDNKVDTIFSASSCLDYLITTTELEALLLEARLIQSNQPRCNVLLKTGQPFLYLFIPIKNDKNKIAQLQIVRNQKQRGTYFGPFLEKAAARRVYTFLLKTFCLRLCHKKIENGCLYYHMGQCAGACRSDFDSDAYNKRLELAKKALQQGHKKFLQYLHCLIQDHNKRLEFEQSRELHQYYEAFEKIFMSLGSDSTAITLRASKDVWVFDQSQQSLHVFSERECVLKHKHVFYVPYTEIEDERIEYISDRFVSYYRLYAPPATIVVNTAFDCTYDVYAEFLQEWHLRDEPITILCPTQGHNADLIRLALVQASTQFSNKATLAHNLQKLLQLSFKPHSIDCFDISHKQGMNKVGSCVRFVDGVADTAKFRRFHIKTVEGQDDYASLREVVARRYQETKDFPDIIMIDGGKGQLHAVVDLFPDVEYISLAKREETVFSKRLIAGKILDQKDYASQVLIALRDYAHHFAISFHKKLSDGFDE